MKKRVKFCNSILEKKIAGQQIMLTDEAKIDLSSFTRDSIRLSKENAQNWKVDMLMYIT